MLALATRRVLLVEDNLGDVSLIRQCVDEFDAVQLFHVPNVVQANRFLHRKSPFDDAPLPDLIILDLRLPIFDGSSVLQGVRDTPALAHLPVVVLTSSFLMSDYRRCADLRATEYVIKPVEWNQWQVTIRRLLRQHVGAVS